MQQKLLVGVAHRDEKELADLLGKLSSHSPTSVALELPEDYLERERYGIETLFFKDIARLYAAAGVGVIGLEDPETFDRGQAIEVAKGVLLGRFTREQLESELSGLRGSITPYVPFEQVQVLKHFAERDRDALAILDEAPALEDVMGLFYDSNSRREAHVLRRILEEQPDIVVIGDAHARELKDRLPGYEYVTFSPG